MGLLECLEETPPKQPREDAYRQKETRPAGDPALPVGRQAATRDDAMHMRVMGQRRAPGVQDQGQPDAGTQMPRIGGDGAQGLGRDLKQQAVDHRLVGIGDRADRRRQGKDEVVVLDRQQVDLAGLEPAPGRTGLTLRAMPITAGVVGNLGMLTGGTLQHMATQRRTAALLDRRHDLELAEAKMPVMGSPKGFTMGTEDVTDLELRSGHHADLRRGLQVQILQRPLHLMEDFRRHMGVAGGIVELLVAEQHLDHADILPLLQ